MSERKTIAWDLETIADPAMVAILPEVKAKSNLKDEYKIAADIEEKKQKQLLDMGLDPLVNMICCFGWADGEDSGTILLKDTESEKDLLLAAWDVLAKYDHFTGFNSRAFDLRCMLLHGISHGIRPSVSIDHGKYNRGNHTDLRGILAGDGPFAKGKLDFFCKKFLGDQKTEGIDGAMVQSYWDMGLHDDIAEYCQKDAELTYQLYLKCETAGLTE